MFDWSWGERKQAMEVLVLGTICDSFENIPHPEDSEEMGHWLTF